ncbi:MAG TPA: SIMPL domain-containing protein [Gemmatimonadaceae bacterium]|nr:SIMPL domain-containing protein [Gemmatimonadaceae bacterium]
MRIPVLGLIAALAAPFGVSAQTPAPVGQVIPSVVTSAQGEARVRPDRATIVIGVETRAATAQAAGADNARRQQAVIDTLRKLGVPAARIQSAEYTVYPERVYDSEGRRPRITGYIARNTVRVELENIALAGPAVDAALARGANTINSLQFESSKADSARREALSAAVRLARADADAMATAAGRCIADVIELTTNEMVRPLMMEMAARGAADQASTPIEPGEQIITVTVQGRWQLHSIGRVCPQ